LPVIGSSAIQLLSPGPLSKVVSPVIVSAYVIPGYGNHGLIELFGEDGRVLAQQELDLYTTTKWSYFYWELPFKVSGEGEAGLLTVSTRDGYGRLTAVYSTQLLLLADGLSIVNPSDILKERCVIEQPAATQRISGGVLTVAGRMRPFNNLPVTVELVTQDRSVIGSQMVNIPLAADGSYVAFRVDVPYTVSGGTWALLVVRQADENIGKLMYLYSQAVFLNP